jgi:hypothetical protein
VDLLAFGHNDVTTFYGGFGSSIAMDSSFVEFKVLAGSLFNKLKIEFA